jgi:uncharacterized protein (DUF1330 family)
VDGYRRYQMAHPAVFAKFNATVVVADETPRVLEGDWPRDKTVILSFPDEAEAARFGSSPEYLEIAKDSTAGADAVIVMARAFEQKG